MSEPTPDRDRSVADSTAPNADDLGGLTVEDDPAGTVDPAELAGGADRSDADVPDGPEYSEEDLED